MAFKIICELVENSGSYRVANLSGEAAAIFLNFGQGFLAVRHDRKLEQPEVGNYRLAVVSGYLPMLAVLL
jgi:hypothetical protein